MSRSRGNPLAVPKPVSPTPRGGHHPAVSAQDREHWEVRVWEGDTRSCGPWEEGTRAAGAPSSVLPSRLHLASAPRISLASRADCDSASAAGTRISWNLVPRCSGSAAPSAPAAPAVSSSSSSVPCSPGSRFLAQPDGWVGLRSQCHTKSIRKLLSMCAVLSRTLRRSTLPGFLG